MRKNRAFILPATAAICLCLSVLAAGDEAGDRRYSIQLGAGYGTWYKGLLILPVDWTASSPDFVLAFEASAGRFQHSLRAGFAAAGALYVNGVKHSGRSTSLWLPVDYHFTWFCSRNAFGWKGLDWGFGGAAQFLHMSESLEIQTDRATRHRDDYAGVGFNTAFRWHDSGARWKAALRFSLTVSFPPLSKWGVRSEVIPAIDGTLMAARTGFLFGVERRISGRWACGLFYERDAFFSMRSRTNSLSLGEMTSAGNFLLTHLTARIGYEW